MHQNIAPMINRLVLRRNLKFFVLFCGSNTHVYLLINQHDLLKKYMHFLNNTDALPEKFKNKRILIMIFIAILKNQRTSIKIGNEKYVFSTTANMKKVVNGENIEAFKITEKQTEYEISKNVVVENKFYKYTSIMLIWICFTLTKKSGYRLFLLIFYLLMIYRMFQ
ncbi:hypothetical protein EHP00_1300 [Ecytonucleospora hepatopenaei]|uniref:Uncharacterized protein n=1 Tax=Ecytonucleospora hepatopenaei TaxID=646526 RepID=A0A1W0E6R1_9MICR|nr:hypothetical protein EHP00_1300 [Ecytonucleospora hepatopenaei]